MDLASLRRRCERRLRSLELPVPFDAHAFSADLASRRGRPIYLHPIASRDGPWGLWVATPSADFIFFEEATSPLHQQHIILHELSHLVCDHTPLPVTDPALHELLLPNLAPGAIQRVLRRVAYSNEDEREAELLASLILGQTAHGPVPVAIRTDPYSAAAVTRLIAMLPDELGERP